MATTHSMRLLLAPLLLSLPLALFTGVLALPVQSLVLCAWCGVPLCLRWGPRGWGISCVVLALATLMLALNSSMPSALWLTGLALYCFLSLWTMIPPAAEQVKVAAPPVPPTPCPTPVPTITMQEHQGTLVAHQHALEKLQAAREEERTFYSQQIAVLQQALADEKQQHQLTHTQCQQLEQHLQQVVVRGESLACAKEALTTALEQLKIEHSDLQACYQHVNTEWQRLANPAAEDALPIESSDPQVLELDRDRRRYRGLYLQLKEQFDEKSATLDTTRAALFQAEEALLAQAIDTALDEKTATQVDVWHAAYQQATTEQENLTQAYQIEIEALQQIIATLSQPAGLEKRAS